MAYVSTESDRPHVYVKPYGREGRRVQVSVDGAVVSFWSPATQELFLLWENWLLTVPYSIGDEEFHPGKPVRLFETSKFATSTYANVFAVTQEAQRFLVLRNEEAADPQINVVLNWFDELRRLVPTDQ